MKSYDGAADIERLDRIDRILRIAIAQERVSTSLGARLTSCCVVGRTLGVLSEEEDLDELVNLLVIDALYARLEKLMRAQGWLPFGDGTEYGEGR